MDGWHFSLPCFLVLSKVATIHFTDCVISKTRCVDKVSEKFVMLNQLVIHKIISLDTLWNGLPVSRAERNRTAEVIVHFGFKNSSNRTLKKT